MAGVLMVAANPLYDVPVITSAFFLPSTTQTMIGARVVYRPMETRRSLTTDGVILDISVHPRGIVWVFVKPRNETMTPRWYIASDVIVSYVWGVEPESCAHLCAGATYRQNGCLYPCACKIVNE